MKHPQPWWIYPYGTWGPWLELVAAADAIYLAKDPRALGEGTASSKVDHLGNKRVQDSRHRRKVGAVSVA